MKKLDIVYERPKTEQCIYIGKDIQDVMIEKLLGSCYDKIFFVVDGIFFKKRKEWVEKIVFKSHAVGLIKIASIMRKKDYQQCEEILKKMIKHGLTRRSCIVGIGGGHVGDISGFIAAIFMRGIDFVQIPTTFMSMSDAIVGKVAVNVESNKNVIGSFFLPNIHL